MELDERKKVTISLELAASFSEASVIASWLVTQLCAPDPKLMLFCIENPAASLLWGNRHIKGPLERLKSALPCEVFDDVVCLCMFGEDEETGKQFRKPTRLLHNNKTLHTMVQGLVCSRHSGCAKCALGVPDGHDPVQKDGAHAQICPTPLAQILAVANNLEASVRRI